MASIAIACRRLRPVEDERAGALAFRHHLDTVDVYVLADADRAEMDDLGDVAAWRWHGAQGWVGG